MALLNMYFYLCFLVPITFFVEKLEIISKTLMFLYPIFVTDFERKKTFSAT